MTKDKTIQYLEDGAKTQEEFNAHVDYVNNNKAAYDKIVEHIESNKQDKYSLKKVLCDINFIVEPEEIVQIEASHLDFFARILTINTGCKVGV